MIIYQFHMLSTGIIKISKAEYKEAVDYKDDFYYKKIRVLEKGIRCPEFPTKLYKLGVADYNKYYALSKDELEKFISYKKDIFKERKHSLEIQLKKYNEMIENLDKNLQK